MIVNAADRDGATLCCDKLGRIWVGHLNHGVSVYDGRVPETELQTGRGREGAGLNMSKPPLAYARGSSSPATRALTPR